MKEMTATWTGIRPLLMHNAAMVDHRNPLVVQIKNITNKGSKKMTETDYDDRDRLEWEAGLYTDEKSKLVIPSDNVERCVQLGAQKSRAGKEVGAAVLMKEESALIKYDGPKTLDALYADPRFSFRKSVGIQKKRIMRIRPMIPTGWSITFTLEFDDTIINASALMKAMVDAGALIGLGDWRPKFGRFLVTSEK